MVVVVRFWGVVFCLFKNFVFGVVLGLGLYGLEDVVIGVLMLLVVKYVLEMIIRIGVLRVL